MFISQAVSWHCSLFRVRVLTTSIHRVISLGKYGSFQANQIIGRPYHLTFEILDQPSEVDNHALRIVSAAELHTESLIADGSIPGEADDGEVAREEEDAGNTPMRTNQDTLDDNSSQRMTMDEIEALKKGTTGAGREIINKLLESHSAIDKKTEFSLAKYTLRKRKKYLKRFSVLPLDVPLLAHWMLEQKDAAKIMELRDESIGLIGCWANVHNGGDAFMNRDSPELHPAGRWLVVDDTGGLVVAAMAERMGILSPPEQSSDNAAHDRNDGSGDIPEPSELRNNDASSSRRPRATPGMSSTNTTLTVIHPNVQPNLSLLKYFSFDISDPPPSHPLHNNLKTLSWLQLLDPQSDPIYTNEPPFATEAMLASWKPNKRGIYYRKRRRWSRVRNVVDETRAGGFDGLIVASLMDPTSILKYTVPLLSGSAPVVVYSPHIEPLLKVADFYSTARRTAYIYLKRTMAEQNQALQSRDSGNGTLDKSTPQAEKEDATATDERSPEINDADFPVDPTLLLAPTIQTSRVRQWQVLPGRTHPMMTSRGGAEGYIFHAIRALPSDVKVEARGHQGRKKRKTDSDVAGDSTEVATPMEITNAGLANE
ncbi:hypothetical protein FQN50_000323 [Emmonsiellopsis sp. PD_5]|nr:hypothetical protein FQN50_000323 [Emmonsiellopsis sp. PD_5]